MDVHTKEQRSYNMSRIRGKHTKPELILRKNLWSHGLRFQTHYKLPGRPDVVFVNQKLAVFVDGCFWHGCIKHGIRPKSNSAFWNQKIENNIERDKRTNRLLKNLGWKVVRIWEHEINYSVKRATQKILHYFP